MVDVFSSAKRSEVMASVKGRGNLATEVALARLFKAEGITGWRRHYTVTGRPDFAFPKSRVAVFVDGCFWHACRKCRNIPEKNRGFWKAKLQRNVARDRLVNRELRSSGWIVVRIWEHELRDGLRVVGRVRDSLLHKRAASGRKTP